MSRMFLGGRNADHVQAAARPVSALPAAVGSQAPLRGIGIMVLACLFFPVGDAIAKHLVGIHDVLLILWLKYVVQTALVGLVMLFTLPLSAFRSSRWRLQIGRGLFGIGSYGPFLVAISFIPLADAIAIEFSAPLIVVALSVPLLGERVGMRRWVAVCVGFIGTLLIVRPGLGMVHWAAMLMLVAATSVALMQIASRALARTEHSLTSLFYLSLTGLVLTSPPVPFVWAQLDLATWGLMLAVGGIAGFCHYLFILAYEFATAALLAPFMYAQIIGATILGYLMFADVPDAWTISGTAILVASGLYVAYRENRASQPLTKRNPHD